MSRSDGPVFAREESAVAVSRSWTLFPTSRGKIIGRDPRLNDVMGLVRRVAASNCNVLVTGESGTGKELVIAALHDASTRRDKPLVCVNCGAIPEALLESELFGHAKGAFTGAHASRLGKVAAAEGGTLFLDEIGELPLHLQVKLLRLIQQREYSPVGETRVSRCNVRIVAATHRDLEREVSRGAFREDLYYRLNVVNVHVPALRERPGDIELLARYFFERAAENAGRDDLEGFDDEALSVLASYEWPGNVRMLENAIERAVLLAQGPRIAPTDFPLVVRRRDVDVSDVRATLPDAGIDMRASVEQYENNLIRQALERTAGNRNRAAQLLGINRTTLVEMIKRKRLAG